MTGTTTTTATARAGMRARRWAAALAAVLVTAVTLTGCSQLPTDGPVREGRTAAPAAGTIQYDASRPVAGTGPEQIVQGFIQAGAAGLSRDTDFDVARSFLTARAAAGWAPLDQVVVAANDEPQLPTLVLPGTDPTATPVPPSDDDVEAAETIAVALSVVAVGDVNERGIYRPALQRTRSELVFGLVRVEGEWRIETLPEGLLLTEGTFGTVFRGVPLSFVTPDGEMTVPDMRYVPTRGAPGYAVELLLGGPAAWLAPGVVTHVPSGLALVPGQGVLVDEATGVAEVHLGDIDAPLATRDLVYRQVRDTLLSIPGVWDVSVWFGAVPHVPAAGADLPTAAPGVGGTLVAVSQGRLVTVTGEDVTPYVPDEVATPDGEGGEGGEGTDGGEGAGGEDSAPDGDPDGATEGEAGSDGATEAGTEAEVRADTGSDGGSPGDQPSPVPSIDPAPAPAPTEVLPSPEASAPPVVSTLRSPTLGYGTFGVVVIDENTLVHVLPTGERTELLEQAGLLAPSIDRLGWVWTGAADQLLALQVGGEPVEVTLQHADATTPPGQIVSVRVSREGARAVVLTRRDGIVTATIHAVVRDADGAPRALATGVPLAEYVAAYGAVWADATTVVTLGTLDDQGAATVRALVVGGPATAVSSTAQAVSLAAGDGLAALVVATSEGRLLARMSSRGWEEIAEGISAPSFPG